jgi:hypothetical protein
VSLAGSLRTQEAEFVRPDLVAERKGDVMGWLSTKEKWEYSVLCGEEVMLVTDSKDEANKKVTELQFAGKHHVRVDKSKKGEAK